MTPKADQQMQNAALYVQSRTAKSGSSFYYAFLFLPPQQRAAITAFYAFCREVDDVVDDVSDMQLARIKLAWWRTEVAQLYEGSPSHPALVALAPHVSTFQIEAEHLLGVIDGVELDTQQNRWLDFAALERYCHLVAGLVGHVAANIFGHSRDETLQYAERLGLAFQLTNIIRDVGEDARKGRIYLPLDELRAHGVTTADILQGRYTPAFAQLMRFQATRAQQVYDEALALLPQADRRRQRPGLMMAAIYRELLRQIERDGFQVLDRRTSLTPLYKIWLAWRTWVFGA